MIQIISENEYFLIVDKPAGLSFHKDEAEEGLFSLVEKQINLKLFSIHRLDKVTSGLVIFAKDNKTASAFGELFSKHIIKKTYIALSKSRPTKKQGTVKGDIEKGRGGSYRLLRTMSNPSITKFTSTFVNEFRVFKLHPQTGQTHQLRVVLASLGSPILGDIRYKAQEADRTYLHAYGLEFNLFGDDYMFECLPSGGHFDSLELEKIIESL